MVTVHRRRPDSPGEREALLSIAAVERETGLGKDTLRAWERRYGFPRPQRDAAGARGYPRAQVERLRLVRRALMAGQRPGRLFALPPQELDALLAAMSGTGVVAPGAAGPLALSDCTATLRGGGALGLRHWLGRALARLGLEAFATSALAALTTAVGQARLDGRVAAHEERLYHEAVQSVMRAGLLPLQAGPAPGAPCVLLAAVPGERRGSGLLAAEAMLALQACRCLPLGAQAPLDEIVDAAKAHRVDVVALDFADGPPGAGTLAELRSRLPAGVAVWACGAGVPRRAGVRALAGAAEIASAVAQWRKDAGLPVN